MAKMASPKLKHGMVTASPRHANERRHLIDDSASSDPYEDDSSSEEEGEVDDVTYKSQLSLHTRDEPQADSDDELDAKRVDPLSDETEYMLDKSKAKYAKKYTSSFICQRRRSAPVF